MEPSLEAGSASSRAATRSDGDGVGDGVSEGVGEGVGLGDGLGEASNGSTDGVAAVDVVFRVVVVVPDGLLVVVVVLGGGGGAMGVGRPDRPGCPTWLAPGCAGAFWPGALLEPAAPGAPGGVPASPPSGSGSLPPMLSPCDAGPL